MAIERASPRHRRRLRMSLGRTPAFTSDISAGGFSIETLRTPPPGTRLEGIIRFAEGDVPFTGMVVWARAGAPHLNLKGRIGVRFTSIPPAAARYLASESLSKSA